jgi:hypothetical protein
MVLLMSVFGALSTLNSGDGRALHRQLSRLILRLGAPSRSWLTSAKLHSSNASPSISKGYPNTPTTGVHIRDSEGCLRLPLQPLH